MKLELKHLAIYLPYQLNLADASINNGIIEMQSIHLREDELWLYSPILRPLSDLSKGRIYKKDGSWLDFKMMYDLHLFEGEWCEEWNAEYGESPKAYVPITGSILFHLCEYHFDIFGLIAAGLAIDINTLTTP